MALTVLFSEFDIVLPVNGCCRTKSNCMPTIRRGTQRDAHAALPLPPQSSRGFRCGQACWWSSASPRRPLPARGGKKLVYLSPGSFQMPSYSLGISSQNTKIQNIGYNIAPISRYHILRSNFFSSSIIVCSLQSKASLPIHGPLHIGGTCVWPLVSVNMFR